MTDQWDVIVVGGGPTGLSAALLLGRALRRVLVVDAGQPRNRFAAHMHGVLGSEDVPPSEFAERGRAEAAAYGVVVRDGTVERAMGAAGGIAVVLADGERVEARALVVASGVTDELPDIPGVAERWGASVLHCPYCHGWEFRDQRLGVLLTSPLGLHQVELVRQWSEHVVAFTAGAGPLTVEQERRLRSRDIVLAAEPVLEVQGERDRVTGIATAGGAIVPIDALYVMAALRPNDGFLTSLRLARTDTPFGGFLTVDPTGRTSHERIWAVGNVANPAANIPLSIGAGALAGGAVNAALIAAEFDAATA